ncbi:MAG: tetratricopeptide repeat protein [Verrucomicrobiales bacterium]|nr:tetratricopeptide repeat protein [Verrucomicrobiales bacterium]
MENFYKIINVSPTAKEDEIKEALHAAQRLWSNRTNSPHMDRRQEAERFVKMLEEAETILLNPAKRAEYDRALKSAPPPIPQDRAAVDSATNLIEEGRRLLAEGNIGDALYAATKATEKEGGNPEAWALLGRARFRFGDVEDAIYEYKRAIKLKPNEGDYYSELGDIYDDTGKLDEALTQYRKAAQVEPSVPWYRGQVGYVLRKQGHISEATEILQQCHKEQPDSKVFRYELAVAYVYGCQNSWTFVPEGGDLPSNYYPTSKAQIRQGLEFLRKAESMNSDDPNLKETIGNFKAVIKESIERKYIGSTGAAIVGGIIWFCAYGLGLVFLPFYFYASRPPRYSIYKSAIGNQATGGQKAMQTAAKVANVIGATENVRGTIGLAVIIGTGLFLPVMAIVNYVKNYTGENNVKDLQIQ